MPEIPEPDTNCRSPDGDRRASRSVAEHERILVHRHVIHGQAVHLYQKIAGIEAVWQGNDVRVISPRYEMTSFRNRNACSCLVSRATVCFAVTPSPLI